MKEDCTVTFATIAIWPFRVAFLGFWPVVALGFTLVGACGDEVQVGAPAAPAAGPVVTPATSDEADLDAGGGVPPLNYSPSDFSETERNRDPFRSFSEMFRTRQLDAPQREVVMSNTGVDQMRLSMVVTGTVQRAVIVDQFGVGFPVKRGDFIGRAEVAHLEGGSAMPLTYNWRVERIRSFENGGVSEVVLTREDPTSPDSAPITHVIPLHDAESTP